MAALRRVALLLAICRCIDAGGKRKAGSSKASRSNSNPAPENWSDILQSVYELSQKAMSGAGSSGGSNSEDSEADNMSSAFPDSLKGLWEANLHSRIIEPCERWVNASDEKMMRTERIASAKFNLCGWNAFSGFLAGAVPVPGLDLLGSAGAGFLLQAQGACIVAKIRGYDVHDEKTQAMMLWALTGEAGSEVAKKVVQVATKTAGTTAGRAALKSMPNQVFKQLNKAVWPLLGRHLITKGPQGLLSLAKLTPLVGSVVGSVAGSAVDWKFCQLAIDHADQQVFRMINKEQEELRRFLMDSDFEDEVKALMDAQLDSDTICDVEKSDLQELGLPLGRILKLRKKLFGPDGPCRQEL
ncbi:unnamed protein product [Effrenium voratum]|uniref:SAM domain-containing protein n=1 Tax=Effrenium voratum TaxID=2562239 RepID=A0AA36I9B5_9DINO|nr:unnamed protein product [Effrenium voratum]CAJ1446602.1 unnamed protein product [Effrenium voratum]